MECVMMNTTSHNNPDEREDADDLERLMTRIIDREAEDADQQRFERMASDDPSLWRTLAEQQQDMLELSQDVASELASAFRVNVDLAHEHRTAASSNARNRSARPLWWLGWAAAIALAAGWIIHTAVTTGPLDPAAAPAVPAFGGDDRLSPEQHLHQYLRSPFVVGELDPIMLRHEATADGRIELRILRRIEEAYLLDANDPLPIDADGRLIRDPAELQQRSIGAGDSN